MKISTKGRYGLRAMLDIAVNSAGDHVALNSIADRQEVSESYLEHVFSMLKKAGLVKSIKGAQGGYMLTDKPSNISVGQVLRALEGDLSVVDETEDVGNKKSMEYCISNTVWKKINAGIKQVVDSITLEQLADEYKKMNGNISMMFYI